MQTDSRFFGSSRSSQPALVAIGFLWWTCAAGFPRARTIEALDDLERQLPAITAEDGPSFTVLRVEPETGFLRTPPMTYEGPEMKYRFGRALERRFGIEVVNVYALTEASGALTGYNTIGSPAPRLPGTSSSAGPR